jgi:hypothetical protein
MSSANQNVPLSELNARQLRERLYNLLEQEISDLNAFETQFHTLYALLKEKETAPPRSQFWNIVVLIPQSLASTYSRINSGEIPGAIFMALGLNKFGGDEDGETTLTDPSDSKPFLPLGHLSLADFPERLSNMCKHFFGSATTGFRFLLKCKPVAAESSSAASTEVARMLEAREQILDKIVRIDETREKLATASKNAMPQLRTILRDDMETRADSDNDSDDSHDENDDSDDPDADPDADSDEELKPSPSKRRKCYDEMGTGKDTDLQKIRLDGITINSASGVVGLRTREFRGEPEPHFIELMGAIACDAGFINRLPKPTAPTYSDGAELDYSRKLMHPGTVVASNTVVTQKMMDTNNSLVRKYDDMQAMAYTLRRGLRELSHFTHHAFEFIVRVESGDAASVDYTIEPLTVMQKFAIGQLYLHSISIRRDAAYEEEEEEEEESSDEDDDSGSEYVGSDDEEDDEEDGEEESEESEEY